MDPDPVGSVFNRLPGSGSEIEYGFRIRSYINEDLQGVSRQLATMQVTQVSVDCLFSALKLLKSDLRNELNDDDIGDVLLGIEQILRSRFRREN